MRFAAMTIADSSSDSVERSSWCARSHRSPVPNCVDCCAHDWMTGESSFVDLIRDETTHVGVHPASFGDEDALVVGQRRVLTQDVFEHARARSVGMFGLGDLTELQAGRRAG